MNQGVPSDPLATPDFFPMKIDVQRNTIQFVQMSRDSFRRSVFLDRRAVVSGSTTLTAAIPQLLRRRAERPMHFILHGAFCGSTLLTRYLEDLPYCFVLREPGVLGQLAGMRHTMPAEAYTESWEQCLRATFTLLARAYATDAAVIVKPADLCNWMGNLLLDHDASTKIVFLNAPLKVFLLQVLKAEDRRRWVRAHIQAQALRRPMALVPFLAAIVAADLTDGQCAAAMWLLNSFLCRSLLARRDSHRVIAVNGEDLADRPEPTVRAVADFLGLADDEVSRTALDRLHPSSTHAKDGQVPYDATARASVLADAEARYAAEMQAALSWAHTLAAGWLDQCPFPIA